MILPDDPRMMALIALISFFVLDSIHLIAERFNTNLENWYFLKHQEFGVLRVSFLKLLCLFGIIYALYNPPLHPKDPYLVTGAYILWATSANISVFLQKMKNDDN